MRRGGRLILLLGVLIAAVVALGVIFFLQQGGTSPSQQALLPPTTAPTRRVVIAQADIPRNTLLTDTERLLDYSDIPEQQFNASPNDYFIDKSELSGKVTVGSISALSPVRARDVTDAGLSVQIPAAQAGQPRTKAISVLVNNLTGVADEITPNDFVDVLASFSINRVYLRPGFNDQGQVRFVEEQFTGQSTKTLIQNVQVLRIKRPEVAPEGTTTPTAQASANEPQVDQNGQPVSGDQAQQQQQGGTNAAANSGTITPGSWLLVLAMTDQQAELLKFSRETGNGITLVLRGRGDSAAETTLGATLDLLVSNFGLPVPNPEVPFVAANNALTPQPTAAQPVATTPTPTR